MGIIPFYLFPLLSFNLMGKYQTLNTKAITGLTFSHHQGITEVQSSMLARSILNVKKMTYWVNFLPDQTLKLHRRRNIERRGERVTTELIGQLTKCTVT